LGGANILIIKQESLTNQKRNLDIEDKNTQFCPWEILRNPENHFSYIGKVYFKNIHQIRTG
jgi:hypothetical protein